MKIDKKKLWENIVLVIILLGIIALAGGLIFELMG
jgi:hypothetical protein